MTFFTPERMTEFWDLLKIVLKVVVPVIMMSFALSILGLMIDMVMRIFKKDKNNNNDDDDIDVMYY